MKYSVPKITRPNDEACVDLGQVKTRSGQLGHRHTHRLPTVHTLFAKKLIPRGTREETVKLHGDIRIARDDVNVELDRTIGIGREVHRGGRREEKPR